MSDFNIHPCPNGISQTIRTLPGISWQFPTKQGFTPGYTLILRALFLSLFALPVPLIAQDTISRLESRTLSIIDIAGAQFKSTTVLIDSLQSAYQREKDRDTKVHLNKAKDRLQSIQRRINYSKELLGEIRQLRWKNEADALVVMKRISGHLVSLEKEKLPDFDKQKIIPTTNQVKSETEVYDQQVFHFCKLTRSADGLTLANEFETLFEFTDPKLSLYYKDSEFLVCKARFIKTNKDYFLEINFTFNSPQADKMMGQIDAESPCRIDFINGTYIYLQTLSHTDANKNVEDGKTFYLIRYKLDQEEMNALSKFEMDTLTFVWTSGADKYEIVDLDVLKNMFACLKTKS
ncbi:MAG: hypothetical protein IPM34_10245 [Saprospiraceae bacterium]|nr:hypothetical protein [Saprospiraceae bacterium]